MTNPMIAALQKSRSSAPSAPPAPLAPGDEQAPEAAGPGDAMIEKLSALDSKLDQILNMLGADQTKDDAEDNKATEAPPNDDGY